MPSQSILPPDTSTQADLSGIDFRKKYLPGLDTLRCFAASLVVFGHVDTGLYMMGHKAQLYKFFPFLLGDKAVVFFFVLSGFLITYLLLKEREMDGDISLKKFYARRIFRIWPVYYIVVGLAVFALDGPGSFSTRELILLGLISPNIALVFNGHGLGHAIHTWSIGIEEQFYLIWPLVIRSRNYFKYILYIYAGITMLSSGIIWVVGSMPFVPPAIAKVAHAVNTFFTFEYSFRIDAMAVGSIGAWLIINRKLQVLEVMFSRPFQYITYGTLAIIVFFPSLMPYQFHNVVYLSVIMNVSFNPHTLLRLENRVTSYIGKISYGVYMYHFLFVGYIAAWCVNTLGMRAGLVNELLICFICLAASVGVSALSFHLIESPILKLKNRWIDKRVTQHLP